MLLFCFLWVSCQKISGELVWKSYVLVYVTSFQELKFKLCHVVIVFSGQSRITDLTMRLRPHSECDLYLTFHDNLSRPKFNLLTQRKSDKHPIVFESFAVWTAMKHFRHLCHWRETFVRILCQKKPDAVNHWLKITFLKLRKKFVSVKHITTLRYEFAS